MFSVLCKLSFKSSRISVAILFHRRLLGAKVFAYLVGLWVWESQTIWCQTGGPRIIQRHLPRSRTRFPLLCPVIFDSSLLCKLSSFQGVVSETYCNKKKTFRSWAKLGLVWTFRTFERIQNNLIFITYKGVCILDNLLWKSGGKCYRFLSQSSIHHSEKTILTLQFCFCHNVLVTSTSHNTKVYVKFFINCYGQWYGIL